MEIKDTTSEIKDFTCAEALESFYEDEDYIYYWNCMKDKYMIVKYESGFEETISNALKHETITIDDLETYNIEYVKHAKEQEKLNSPPELFFYIDDNEKAKGMIGTYSWKIIKDGEETVLTADAKHSSQIKYNDINTLKLNDTKINLKSNNAEISSANIYNIDKTEKIKKISYNNNEILVGDLKTGEYVLEIVANYSQGNVCYSIKPIVE